MSLLKFLIDENISQTVINYFIQKGYDVIIVKKEFPGREDSQLLGYAYRENRIIITNDKDFGFFVYYQKLPTRGIILFRFTEEFPSLKIAALEEVLNQKPDKILNHFIVITESGFRIRPLTI